MKQLFSKAGAVVIKEVAEPLMDEHEVRVCLHYSCVSPGTEMATLRHAATGILPQFLGNMRLHTKKIIESINQHGLAATLDVIDRKRHRYLPLGYSCAGQVVAKGARVHDIAVGDYVAVASSSHAYHATYITTPTGCVTRLPNAGLCKWGSTVALGAIAMHALRRASLQFGETVCVLGLGLLGQLIVRLAQLAGYHVIAFDLDPKRVSLVIHDRTTHVTHGDIAGCIADALLHTEGRGVDATIITAGTDDTMVIDQAMQMTRQRGVVVVVGDVPLTYTRARCYAKEIDVRLSCSYGPGRYDERYETQGVDYPYGYVRWTERRNMAYYIALLADGKIPFERWLLQTVPFMEAPQAYARLQKQQTLGLLLVYDALEKETARSFSIVSRGTVATPLTVAKKQRVRLALIGGGGFAQTKLLPLLGRMPAVQLHTLVEPQQAQALTLRQQYRFSDIAADYRSIIDNPAIDMVLIATPHAQHAPMAVDCLRAGKAVLCEKPVAVTYAQLHALEVIVKKIARPCYAVNFNRSFAPLVLQLKRVLRDRVSPLVMHYRMNAGAIPFTHWQQQYPHGGRLIGEACHIIELFCFLVGSPPTVLSVTPMRMADQQLTSPDTFSLQISFYDGSLASLDYVSIGNSDMEKERMELFFDGRSMILDDYCSLYGYGVPVAVNTMHMPQDKGHEALLRAFVAAVQDINLPLPISLDRLVCATKLTLLADELARAGGGRKQL